MNNLILLDPYIIERDGPVPPVVWDVDAARNVRYEDIKADRYDECIEFLRANHLGSETLCRAVRLVDDGASADEMCTMWRFLLADECSVAMIDQTSDRIVAVAIMKIMWRSDHSWSFWRLMAPLRPDSGCAKIVGFQCEFMKYSLRLRELLPTEQTLHLFAVAVARDRKGRRLKEQMLLQAYKVARSVGVQSMLWICTSRNDRERALRVGLELIDEKGYGTYTDDGGRAVFQRLDVGEFYAGLFGVGVSKRAATSLGDYLFPEYPWVDENGKVVPGVIDEEESQRRAKSVFACGDEA